MYCVPGTALASGDVEQTKQRLSPLKHVFYWASSQEMNRVSKHILCQVVYMCSDEEMEVESDSVCRAGWGKPL